MPNLKLINKKRYARVRLIKLDEIDLKKTGNSDDSTVMATCPTPSEGKKIDLNMTDETADLTTCCTPTRGDIDQSLTEQSTCSTPTKKDIQPSLTEETACSTPSPKKENDGNRTEPSLCSTPTKKDIQPSLTEETACSAPSPEKQNDGNLIEPSLCSTPPRTRKGTNFPSFFVRSPAKEDRDCDVMFHIANNDIESQFEVILFSNDESENARIEKDVESFMESTELTPKEPNAVSINLSQNAYHEDYTEPELYENSLLEEESTVYSDETSVNSIASIEYLLNYCGCKDGTDLGLPPNEILLDDE